MPSVACPTCGEKGRIPSSFIGIRIKCKKCGNSFLVTPPVPKAAVAAGAGAVTAPQAPPTGFEVHPGDIAVEGLEPEAWSSGGAVSAAASTEHDHDHDHEHPHDDVSSSFTATHGGEAPATRQYKVLTRKDKWFEGKFDLGRLEEALNHYARQGWVVRSMATPHLVGFSSTKEEELVILLER